MKNSREHVNSLNTASYNSEYFKNFFFLMSLMKGHGFRDILNPICPCSIEAETTTHYFLCCYFYNADRSALINDLNKTDSFFSTLTENKFTDLVLCDSDKFDNNKNHNILMSTIKFNKDSQRFDERLL